MQPFRELKTVRAVIDALGGPVKVAQLFGLTHGAVGNWIMTNIMPARVERAIQLELALLRPRAYAADNLFNWAVTNAAKSRMAV